MRMAALERVLSSASADVSTVAEPSILLTSLSKETKAAPVSLNVHSFALQCVMHTNESTRELVSISGDGTVFLPLYQFCQNRIAWHAAFPAACSTSTIMQLNKKLRRSASYLRTFVLSDAGAAAVDSRNRLWLTGGWAGYPAGLDLLKFWDASGLTQVPAQNIACGSSHLVILSDTGGIWSWGESHFGALACTQASCWDAPLKVPIRKAQAIACTSNASFALVSGSLYSWGRSTEIGRPTRSTALSSSRRFCASPTPVQFPHASAVSSVSCGLKHVLALQSNGDAYAFGGNEFGQCGFEAPRVINHPMRLHPACFYKLECLDRTRETMDYILQAAPAKVLTDLVPSFLLIACGPYTSFAVSGQRGSTLWGWGLNKHGVLGTGDNSPVHQPQKVFCSDDVCPGTSFVSLACSASLTVAQLSNGTFFASGHAGASAVSAASSGDADSGPAENSTRFQEFSSGDPLVSGLMVNRALDSEAAVSRQPAVALVPRARTLAATFNSCGSIFYALFQRYKAKKS